MILSNPKIELALIATCLANGSDTVREAAVEIGEDDFHEVVCRQSWQVMRSLVDSGDVVDEVSFHHRWPKIVENVPRPPDEILEAVAHARTAGEIADLVAEAKDWTRRRTVHLQALKLAAAAANPKANVEDAVSDCQNGIRLPPTVGQNDVAPKQAVQIHVTDLEYRHNLQGKLSGISTGLSRVDDCCDGLQRGEMSIIGARPSHGKSALLLQLAHHAAFVDKRAVLFISMEMSVQMLMRRLNSLETGIKLEAMKKGRMTKTEFDICKGFNLRMAANKLWFFKGGAGTNINRIRSLVLRHVEQNGVELVMVDYLQRVPGVGNHEKRTYDVGEVSSAFQSMALDLNIHVCCAAQLNRDPDKAQGKEKGRLPKICDLADSAQIDRDGDLICLLHRKDMGDEAQLVVAKQRDGHFAIQHLWFDRERCRFQENNTHETV